MTKWYFCVGMRRGGSTLQTQLASSLLGDCPVRLVTPETLSAVMKSEASGQIVILKCHRFLPEVAALVASGDAKILYTYRDVRDVVASITKKYDIPAFAFVHGGLKMLLGEYAAWSEIPGAYVSRYENVIKDIPAEVIRLAAYLGVKISSENADELGSRFGIDQQRRRIETAFNDDRNVRGVGKNQFAEDSLLHRNHIQSGDSGGFINSFDRVTLAALEWQASDWLKSHDYKQVTTRSFQCWANAVFQARSGLHNLKRIFLGRMKLSASPGRKVSDQHR